MTRRVSFLLLAALIMVTAVPTAKAQAAPDMSIVERWLSTNSGIGSLQIDFTQTRRMKAVKVPIHQEGTLWLDYATSQFRWQMGDPAQTIVVSLGENILIIRTPMKRYEVRPSGSGAAPGMAAFANGFPRNLTDFQAKYRVLEIRPEANTQRIVTRPLGEAGRGVQLLTFVIDASHYRLLGVEIDLEDGSSLNTVFRRVQTNVPVTLALFQPPLDGYTETKF